MDILIHAFSGIAVGTVISSFSNKSLFKKISIPLIGGFGGALPDIDAISLWSKFDNTIGSFLNLQHTGKQIYFSKLWYSHHAFFHSLLASLLLGIILGLILYFRKRKFNLKEDTLLVITFVFSFIIHIIEDIPTPSSVWGGVNIFFPSKIYLGGTGNIWWWNNYDIFLILIIIILINTFLLFSKKLKKITTLVFILGFSLIIFQIKTRNFNFNYYNHNVNYQQYEKKSKEIQKKILGEKIFILMEKFDNSIPINF